MGSYKTTYYYTKIDGSNNTCGDDATWELTSEGVLHISGSGAIYDYSSTNIAPWNKKLSSIKQVIIDNGITHIGNYTFANCTKLVSMSVPQSVVSIGKGFINSCTSLTEIGVDASNNKFVSIDSVLFTKDKSELIACPAGRDKELIIPSTVETINDNALNGCSKLTSIKCKTASVISLSTNIFADVDLSNCTLYVPFKSDKTLYEAADYWKDFINIESWAMELDDEETTFKADYFEPGYITYTRTGSAIAEDKYGSFCLPFDIDLSQTDCFKKVYTPIDAVLYNTNTENLCLMFMTNALNSTISAGTPFIGLLNGNDVKLYNVSAVTFTGTETNPSEKLLTVFNFSGDGALWQKEDVNVYFGGTYAKTEVTASGTYSFSSTGNFGDKAIGSFLSPFRAYVQVVNTSNAGVKGMELWLDDKATSIADIIANKPADRVDVYNVNGAKIRSNVSESAASSGLQSGLYIINGKKVFIK